MDRSRNLQPCDYSNVADAVAHNGAFSIIFDCWLWNVHQVPKTDGVLVFRPTTDRGSAQHFKLVHHCVCDLQSIQNNREVFKFKHRAQQTIHRVACVSVGLHQWPVVNATSAFIQEVRLLRERRLLLLGIYTVPRVPGRVYCDQPALADYLLHLPNDGQQSSVEECSSGDQATP